MSLTRMISLASDSKNGPVDYFVEVLPVTCRQKFECARRATGRSLESLLAWHPHQCFEASEGTLRHAVDRASPQRGILLMRREAFRSVSDRNFRPACDYLS